MDALSRYFFLAKVVCLAWVKLWEFKHMSVHGPERAHSFLKKSFSPEVVFDIKSLSSSEFSVTHPSFRLQHTTNAFQVK